MAFVGIATNFDSPNLKLKIEFAGQLARRYPSTQALHVTQHPPSYVSLALSAILNNLLAIFFVFLTFPKSTPHGPSFPTVGAAAHGAADVATCIGGTKGEIPMELR